MRFEVVLPFFGIVLCNCEFNETENDSGESSNLAKAVGEVVAELFSRGFATANVISSDGSQSLRDFKNELSREIFTSTKASIRHESTSQLSAGQVKKFSIFIVQTSAELNNLQEKLTSNSFKFNGFYLVVVAGQEITELDGIFKIFWNLQIYNVNIMLENADSVVEANTFFPFGAGKCSDTSPVLIHKYENGKFTNDIKNFFPDKVKNLHNCPIRVAVFNNSEPSVFVNRQRNGSIQLSGSDINLVKTLAQCLTFKINYTFIGFNAFYCESFNSSIPFKSTFNGQADMSLSYWLLKVNCLKTFDATTSYTTEKIVFLIPEGRELTFFEKLIYPFDLPLWGMIMACIFTGMFIIFVISRRSKTVQNFVFGTGVGNPYLNLFIGFIGGSQSTLPKMNFARFLLMVLLIYCLVIRTLYTGSFFELLHASKTLKEVQSIDEMVAKDYTFYAQTGIAGLFLGSEAIRSRLEIEIL